MADVKDILGVPRGGIPAEERKPEKKPERARRPEGLSREAFALLGGSNPISPTQLMGGLTKKSALLKKASRPSHKGTVVYRLLPFANQARSDGLQLLHWVKGYKDATGRVRDAHEGDYQFAKYNKQVRALACWRAPRARERGCCCPDGRCRVRARCPLQAARDAVLGERARVDIHARQGRASGARWRMAARGPRARPRACQAPSCHGGGTRPSHAPAARPPSPIALGPSALAAPAPSSGRRTPGAARPGVWAPRVWRRA
jgi:hypothetical protein